MPMPAISELLRRRGYASTAFAGLHESCMFSQEASKHSLDLKKMRLKKVSDESEECKFVFFGAQKLHGQACFFLFFLMKLMLSKGPDGSAAQCSLCTAVAIC